MKILVILKYMKKFFIDENGSFVNSDLDLGFEYDLNSGEYGLYENWKKTRKLIKTFSDYEKMMKYIDYIEKGRNK